MTFIRSLQWESAPATGVNAFKIHKYAYRLFPVLMQLSGKLASEILLDGQACWSLYSAALGTVNPEGVPAQEMALMRVLGIELPGHINLAAITEEDNQLVARLSGGRVLNCQHANEMADWLMAEGVHARDVRVPDWRAGDISPSRGQKISIFEILERAALRQE